MNATVTALSPEDSRAFRHALSHFGTGVAIVTANAQQGSVGATISSFNSVSLDPPLILFSLIKASLGIEQWKTASAFCVSILGEGQIEISNRFAKAGTDKWTDIKTSRACNGAPVIKGCISYFECEPFAIHDGGDHEIFVCRVTHFWADQGNPLPLVFWKGRYQRLAAPSGHAVPPADNLLLHGW